MKRQRQQPEALQLNMELMDNQNQLGEAQREVKRLKWEIKHQRFLIAFSPAEREALTSALRDRLAQPFNAAVRNDPNSEYAVLTRLWDEITDGLGDGNDDWLAGFNPR